MSTPRPDAPMRIGELAERVGISAHALRAWERRYGLLSPGRTSGSYRLYDARDEERVRALLALREAGVPTGEAAKRVLTAARQKGGSAPSTDLTSPAHTLVTRLLAATGDYDELAANAVLDEALGRMPLDVAVQDVVLPFLDELGRAWECGSMSIAQEHFASGLVRRRLAALSLGWGAATGSVAVLACAPGEQHDIVLLCFGILLGRSGWRVRFLGADTPVAALASAARRVDADIVVLAATRSSALTAYATPLRRLAADRALAVAGQGASGWVADDLGAHVLSDDLVAAADEVLRLSRRARRRR